jgi:hypothetical protein
MRDNKRERGRQIQNRVMSHSKESQGIEASSAKTKKKATKIDHAYHDYSIEDINKTMKVTAGESSFPVKLHCMLSDARNSSGIIHWMPHGRAWIVVDKMELGMMCGDHFWTQPFCKLFDSK